MKVVDEMVLYIPVIGEQSQEIAGVAVGQVFQGSLKKCHQQMG